MAPPRGKPDHQSLKNAKLASDHVFEEFQIGAVRDPLAVQSSIAHGWVPMEHAIAYEHSDRLAEFCLAKLHEMFVKSFVGLLVGGISNSS